MTQAVARDDDDGVAEPVDVMQIVNELDALLETLGCTVTDKETLALDVSVVDAVFVDDAESVDSIVCEFNEVTVKIDVSDGDCVATLVLLEVDDVE